MATTTTATKTTNPTLTLTSEGRRSFSDLTAHRLKDYCPASNLAFNEKVKKLIAGGETVYHFGFGQAPFPVQEGMARALKEHTHENAYLPVAGLPELRQELCNFHEHYDKLKFHPDQVVVGPGSKELIFLLMNIFHGDVLVISPTWTTYKPQSLLANQRSFMITTTMENEWRITPASIEKVIKENNLTGNKLLVLCNPDNPTGTSYSASHLAALSEVCRKNNVIVLCDEIYARLHYEQKHDTLARYYPEGTILCTGFSKWASAGGWRLGYHIYPPELSPLRDAVVSAASHTYSCAPAPMQYAITKALRNREEIDDYIKHTTRIMSAVANYCHRELTSAGVKCVRSAGGYYIMPDFEVLREALKKRGITTCTQMCDAMFDEARIALMAGGPAFLRPLDEFTTRLCYVNFDGTAGLGESRRLGLDVAIGDDFLKQYCKPTYDGIQVMKNWVLQQLKSN